MSKIEICDFCDKEMEPCHVGDTAYHSSYKVKVRSKFYLVSSILPISSIFPTRMTPHPINISLDLCENCKFKLFNEIEEKNPGCLTKEVKSE